MRRRVGLHRSVSSPVGAGLYRSWVFLGDCRRGYGLTGASDFLRIETSKWIHEQNSEMPI